MLCADFFQNQLFGKNSFRNTIRMSNSLDPDQARQNVRPDLGPNCLQRLSADDTSRLRVKIINEAKELVLEVIDLDLNKIMAG